MRFIICAFVLALAGLASPAFAAESAPTHSSTAEHARTAVLNGIVKSVGASGSFVVTTERHGDVTVTFATRTGKAKEHGRSHQVVSADAVKVGQHVLVLGRASADGKTFTALRVHVLKARDAGQTRAAHVVGTVATASATSITLTLADGGSQTIRVASDVRVRPEGKSLADLTAGTRVTVVTRDGAATGIVVAGS